MPTTQAHDSGDGDVLNPNKLGLQHRFAVFQKHCNDIVQVVIDLIQCLSLGMSAGETRDKTNKHAGLRTTFNYR